MPQLDTDDIKKELQKIKDDTEMLKNTTHKNKIDLNSHMTEIQKNNMEKYLQINSELFFKNKTEFNNNIVFGLDDKNEFKIGCVKKGEKINNNVYLKLKYKSGDKSIDYLVDHINILNNEKKCSIDTDGIHFLENNNSRLSISEKGFLYKGKPFITFDDDTPIFKLDELVDIKNKITDMTDKVADLLKEVENRLNTQLIDRAKEYSEKNKDHISKILDKLEEQSKVMLEEKCNENKKECMEYLKSQMVPLQNKDDIKNQQIYYVKIIKRNVKKYWIAYQKK